MHVMDKIACVIPARMGSKRFQGKPIAKILGRSMIEHVYRRIRYAKHIDEIYIATCDQKIADEAEKFGGEVIMTSSLHTRGTDRVAEAAKELGADIVINVQGDEPLVDPSALDDACILMKENKQIDCVNLVAPIVDWDIFTSPNVVKTVVDLNGKVLYFSRQPIPTSSRECFRSALKQIGIYFFRKELLLQFSSWEEAPLEIEEGVDMMRLIEHGIDIETLLTKDMISVDTPEELLHMEKILIHDPVYKMMFN